MYSRNLSLLYTQSLIGTEKGYLEFETLPSSWLPFIEAGLIRLRKNSMYRLYPPNRFLIQIFSAHINWFKWDTIKDLVANIRASAASKTIKGKVFELLFALELISPSESKLWKKLGDLMSIKPKDAIFKLVTLHYGALTTTDEGICI